MKKWLGGCLVIGLVVIGMGMWSAYRKLASFTNASGIENVIIAAPVTRVFASLGNADSLSSWMPGELGINAGHHGMLVAGDTLRVGRMGRFTFGAETMKWAVTEVKPNQFLALHLRGDTTGRIVAQRLFTLAAKGESTIVTSYVSAPAFDSIRAHRSDTVKASDAMIAGMSKLLMSSLKMQSHLELQELKNRIERKSANSAGRQ